MNKTALFKIKGMQRDLSESTFSAEFAYENYNIRLSSNESNSVLSIQNEKGTSKVTTADILHSPIAFDGLLCGYAVINDNIIIFITNQGTQSIYKVNINYNGATTELLYKGNLNIPNYTFLETLTVYENEKVQKVYWTDGVNQPRVINIAATVEERATWDDDSFDFCQSLTGQEWVLVQKNTSGGSFPAGIIQYVISYSNNNGAETALFYISPLLYITNSSKAQSADKNCPCSFTINIGVLDTRFDNVRVYSILRSSIDAIPDVKLIAEQPINLPIEQSYPPGRTHHIILEYCDDQFVQVIYENGVEEVLADLSPTIENNRVRTYDFESPRVQKIRYTKNGILYEWIPSEGRFLLNYQFITNKLRFYSDTVTLQEKKYILEITDNGLRGETVNPSELFYKGGTSITCKTLEEKDNTLFLGNIEQLHDISGDSESIQKLIQNSLDQITIVTGGQERYLEDTSYNNDYYENDFQLNANSEYSIKHFKYMETYRFGIQLQYKSGEWTDPIFIKDLKIPFSQTAEILRYPIFKFPYNIMNTFIEMGYIKIRPLVVLPDFYNKECICQGIVCPTVYNIQDRLDNSPFAQASWFYRPAGGGSFVNDSVASKGSVPVINGHNKVINMVDGKVTEDLTLPDDSPLKTAEKKQAEMPVYPLNAYHWRYGSVHWVPAFQQTMTAISTPDTEWEYSYNFYGSSVFYIDNSIITLNSPDIEFGSDIQNISLDGLSFRVIGVAPIKSYYTKFDVDIENIVSSKFTQGLYYAPDISLPIAQDYQYSGRRGINGKGLGVAKRNTSAGTHYVDFSFIPPWAVQGSVRPTVANVSSDQYILKTNKTSNISYSNDTIFYNADTDTTVDTDLLSDVQLFNSQEVAGSFLQSPRLESTSQILYYGNIDKIVTFKGDTGIDFLDDNSHTQSLWTYITPFYRIIDNSKYQTTINSYDCAELYPKDSNIGNTGGGYLGLGNFILPMRYKSTPHIVIALDTEDQYQRVLPYSGGVWDGSYYEPEKKGTFMHLVGESKILGESNYLFWNSTKAIRGWKSYPIDIKINNSSFHEIEKVFLIGELYRNVENKFGATDRVSLSRLSWVQAGPDVQIRSVNTHINYLYGDTFYQRYDSLKTYAFSSEELNSIYELASVMVETKQNLQGRYDSRLGFIEFFETSPDNFNLINQVYSQNNNFFTYRVVNVVNNVIKLPNTLTWTLTKTVASSIDTWTNITLASTLDLDGTKGQLRKLKRYNNELLAFQDSGISVILYNTRTQLSTTEGVPVEIANSGKVDGKRYISSTVGCNNKNSICETPRGLYFVDSLNKGIYLFDGNLKNLSDSLGLRSWVNSQDGLPGVYTLYDSDTQDVLFSGNLYCLAYSERLQQFTSFYQYQGIDNIINLNNSSYTFRWNDGGSPKLYLWEFRKGTQFFDADSQGSSTTLIVNQDSLNDKIFNTVEFRGQGINHLDQETCPFTNIEIWNDYQQGSETLKNKYLFPSNLKQKFRIWRANIPRDTKYKLNRIRSPWAFIKLSSIPESQGQKPIDFKVQDVVVYYNE